MRSRSLRRVTSVAAIVVMLGMSACSSSETSESNEAQSSSGIPLPEDIRAKGAVDVGVFFVYPPYTNPAGGGRLEGIEVDLLEAVTDKLGIEARYHDLTFDALIPSVTNNRSDLLLGPLADDVERHDTVTYIDTLRVEMRALVPTGNPENVDMTNPCGLSSGESTGSSNIAILREISQQCVDEGKPPLQISEYNDGATPWLSVLNGRNDFVIADPAVAILRDQQDDQFEMLDTPLIPESGEDQGWVFSRQKTELRDAFVLAINELIEEGTWQQILGDAGLEDIAIIPPTVDMQPAEVS